jgi:hypothetical protein
MPFTLINSRPVSGVQLYTYSTMDSADTNPTAVLVDGTTPIVGFMQVTGTFGGAAAKLQVSNDNTNWVDAKDISGTTISIIAAGGVEFSTSAVYVRPLVTGGSGTSLSVTLAFRG